MPQGLHPVNAVSSQSESLTSSDSNNAETSWPSRALFAILFVEGAQIYKGQSSGQPKDFKIIV